MKCLLYNFQSNDQKEVKNHYINFHRVDSKNEFFKKIFFEDKNVFYGKRCFKGVRSIYLQVDLKFTTTS